jgi:hypothetical protein
MLLQPVDAADRRRFARTGRAADHHALALATISETSFSAWNVPYHLLTLRISTIGGIGSIGIVRLLERSSEWFPK